MPVSPHWMGLCCCICFEGLTPDACAEDGEGKWDVCKGDCAREAGIVELTNA